MLFYKDKIIINTSLQIETKYIHYIRMVFIKANA